MDQRALVRDMVTETRQRLRQDGWAVAKESDMESTRGRSVSVKIRVHDDLRYCAPPLLTCSLNKGLLTQEKTHLKENG